MAMHQRNTSPLQDPAFLEMMGLFDEKNYWQRLRMMIAGLGRERDSREFKIARLELQRQAAPLMAVLLPVVCLLLLALLSNSGIDNGYYYATQAMYQSGGKRWRRWNEGMWPDYVKAQFIEEKKIADADGVMQDIGWWENSDVHTVRPVMDTCLAALQLMVYYRYLPTFQSVSIPPEIVATAQEPADVKVDVSL